MADIARIKRNIGKMIEMDAPEADIDSYIAEEGVTLEMLKGQTQPEERPLSTQYQPPTEAGYAEKIMQVARPVLEGAGMGLGSVVGGGAALATGPAAPVAVPVGAVLGGGIGYAGGKQLANILEEQLGVRQTPSLQKQLVQSGKDVISGAAMEAGGQGAGVALSAVGQKVIAPFANKIGEETKAVMQLAKEKGVNLSPADVTQSKPLALFENLLGNAPLSAGMIQRYRLGELQKLTKLRDELVAKKGSPEAIEAVGAKVQKQIDDFVNKAGLAKSEQIDSLRDGLLKKLGTNDTYEMLGQKAQEQIAARSRVFNEKASQLYARVGEIIPEETTVYTPNLQKTARMIRDKIDELPDSLQKSNLRAIVSDLAKANQSKGQVQLYGASGKPIDRTGYNWRAITEIRSELGSRIAEADAAFKTTQTGTKLLSNKEAGIYKTLKKSLEKDMEEFANATGGEVKDAFSIANSFYREGKQLFNKPAIFKALKNNPERVVDTIVRPGNITEIKLMKQAVGEKGFEPIRQGVTKRLFEGDDLAAQMDKYGMDTLAQIYKPEELRELANIATGIVKINEHPTVNKFYVDIVRSLNKQPEKVVDLIIRPENTKNIVLSKAVLGEKGWHDVKAKFIEKLFTVNKAIPGQEAELLSPAKFTTNLFKYGDKTLSKVFDADELKAIKEIGQLSKYAQTADRLAGNPSGTAQNLITWSQGALLLANPIAGTSSLLTPPALAKLYLSPAGRKYLTEGFKLPANSQKAAEITAKILAISGTTNTTQGE